jgi:8-oxo-dGTP diphosphatase
MRETIMLTVDPIITIDPGEIVLVKRAFDPYKDYWALPGGFVEYGETVENAAVREAKEETGLDIRIERLSGVYSDPKRDPRGHSVSICFLCRAVGGQLKTSNETKEVKRFSKKELKKIRLAFDHEAMLIDAGFLYKVRI